MTGLISTRLGLFGIGLDAYWPQFPGLKERLEGYLGRVADKLKRPGVEIVNAGLVDNPDRALSAGREFRRAGIDFHQIAGVIDDDPAV